MVSLNSEECVVEGVKYSTSGSSICRPTLPYGTLQIVSEQIHSPPYPLRNPRQEKGSRSAASLLGKAALSLKTCGGETSRRREVFRLTIRISREWQVARQREVFRTAVRISRVAHQSVQQPVPKWKPIK